MTMFVRWKQTAIEVICNYSLNLRQKDLFQYRQRYNTCNVPLLTYHTYTDYNNAKLSIYRYMFLIFYLATILYFSAILEVVTCIIMLSIIL